jgi:hypothetical protein
MNSIRNEKITNEISNNKPIERANITQGNVPITQSTSSRNVEAGSGDTVVLSSQGTQTQTQVQETRTKKELNEAIKVKLTAAGIDYDQLHGKYDGWLNDIGYKFDCGNLNNGTIDKEQYDAILSIIDKTIQKLKDSGKEMTFENLQAETKEQWKKDIWVQSGNSLENFDKLKEYNIRNILGLDENQELTKVSLKAWQDQKKDEFIEKLNSLPTEKEREAYINEVKINEAKELKLITAASSAKDNIVLFEILGDIFAENRTEIHQAIFKSMDQETRTEFADSITNEQLKQTILNTDACGKKMDTLDSAKFVNITVECKSRNGMVHSQSELSAEIDNMLEREDVQTALEKRKTGAELTDGEKKLLDEYDTLTKPIQGGFISGTATSYVLDEDAKLSLLKTMDADISKLPNYREIYSLVNQYECKNMSKEDFDALIDKATNGNYSIVINDEKNGTTTQLNEPIGLTSAELAEKESKTANADYGYVLSEKPNNTRTIQMLQEQIVSQQEDDNTKAEVSSTEDSKESDKTNTSDKQTIENIKEKLHTNSNIKIMEYIFSLKDKNLFQKGIKIFEGLNEQIKELYLRDADSKTFAELAKHTKKTTLEKMVQGERISNYYARRSAEKQLEDYDKNSIA